MKSCPGVKETGYVLVVFLMDKGEGGMGWRMCGRWRRRQAFLKYKS